MAQYFDVVYGLLFLAPGYLSFKLAAVQRDHPRTYDAVEKTAWSLLASGVSLSFAGLLVPVPLADTPIPWDVLASAFLLTSGIAVVVGLVTGFSVRRWYDPSKYRLRHNAWEHADSSSVTPITVNVKTSSRGEIVGNVRYMGTVSKNDLLLKFPHAIERDESGAVEDRTALAGSYLYLSEDEIESVLIRQELEP